MDIGIVTSFYNHYDRFLGQWLDSVLGLILKPAFISIVVSGPDYSEENIENARQRLLESNVPFKITYIKKHKGMGFARNTAVLHSPTEWIQYLDVDDIILPKATLYYSKYKDKADVISGGLRVTGAKKNREIFYKKASREFALSGGYVSCSHGVYKKRLWEYRPYITKNDFVDQVLWLGFAQIGAEFIGTNEICTVYLSRTDGHNLSMKDEDWVIQKEQWKQFVKNGVKYD